MREKHFQSYKTHQVSRIKLGSEVESGPERSLKGGVEDVVRYRQAKP